MPALAEFQPLFTESIDTIRARIDANVNAGLDPTDVRFQDTIPGSFFWDHTQTFAMEAEFLWDFASTELVASFFLPFSWGIYLDYWGELLDVARKAPVKASGVVEFTNPSAAPVIVGPGSQVGALAPDEESEPLTYVVTVGGTVAPAATVAMAVEAFDPGSLFNVGANSVTLVLSGLGALTVNNPAPMTGGEDEELDEPYKARLLLEFSAQRGGGTQADYVAEALAFPSVGHAVVQPVWDGAGTVRVIITDPNNDPLSGTVVAALQAQMDPLPANGLGTAPINSTVTVATAAFTNIAVAATISYEAGYSEDGAGGTEPLADALLAAVTEYVDSLEPGEDVQRNRVISALIEVRGVYDVTALTLNTGGGDVAVAPLEVPTLSPAPVFS